MLGVYWRAFAELIQKPFQDSVLIWGIVPLYFGLLLNELTSSKANYRTALQTGFSFVWAAAQWVYPWFRRSNQASAAHLQIPAMPAINLFVTVTVFALGLVAFISGIRRRFPKYGSFLGYSRFANYFMITIFPIQGHALQWSWNYVIAIGLFAIPVWLLLHFGLMPLRK